MEEYNAERQRLAADLTARRASIEKRLARAKSEIDRLITFATKELISENDLREKLPPLREECERLEAELAAEETPPNVVELHPATINRYRQQVVELSAALNNHILIGNQEPVNALRDLVASVIVHRTKPGEPIQLEVKGRLSALIEKSIFPNTFLAGINSGSALGEGDGSGGGT